MADLLKFMHCGCEYNFCSTKEALFPESIFGDGSDGDCTFEYNADTKGVVQIEAKEYNFNNLTICEGVRLHFCGDGIPVLRVKECFKNAGTIQLRNPFLCNSFECYIDGLGKVIKNSCNRYYSTLINSNLYKEVNFECLSANKGEHAGYGGYEECYPCAGCHCGQGGHGGGGGESGCDGAWRCTQNQYNEFCHCPPGCGGTSAYANAGGGGGGGGGYFGKYNQGKKEVSGLNGCNAPADGIGGDGASNLSSSTSECSCYCYAVSMGAGGGGGYGYCKGGKGGNSYGIVRGAGGTYGGNGGNSYLGDGGDGGCGNACGGHGGNSYYGNGGHGGVDVLWDCCNNCLYPGNRIVGGGGCSYWGNGGDAGCASYNVTYGWSPAFGGSSIYGIGGKGGCGGCGLDGGASTNSCAICGGLPWGGEYGLGLFTKNFELTGCIYGRGGDAGSGGCTSYAVYGSNGAQIYIVVGENYCCSGSISCRGGNGNCGGRQGSAGFVKYYHL